MPTISLTEAEYQAIMWFRYETQDKIENAEDEGYIEDYENQSKIFEGFRKKYHNANNTQKARATVKKALALAEKYQLK